MTGGGVRDEGAGRGFWPWAPKTVDLVKTVVAGLVFWGMFLVETMKEDAEEDGGWGAKLLIMDDRGWGTTLLIMGALGIGANKIVGALHTLMKDQNNRNVKDVRWHLSQQWFVVRLGEVYSYTSCKTIYYYGGVKGVAAERCVFLAMQLLFLLLYFLLDKCRELHKDNLRWSTLSSSSALNRKFCKPFVLQLPRLPSLKTQPTDTSIDPFEIVNDPIRTPLPVCRRVASSPVTPLSQSYIFDTIHEDTLIPSSTF